ncbi:MAG: ABC transporter ATP-binding protein [Candidatus Omnitrophica bacterium]|nr:ABC transporter ATP-binding protein [Candidatus Omnitrophota bacterium]
MVGLLKRMAVLFQKEDRLNFILLFIGILLNSGMEVLGIGLIVPFISLLAHPEMLETNHHLNRVYHFFPFHSFLDFMIVLAVFIVVVFVVKNVIVMVMTFFQTKFIFGKRAVLATRLFRAYMLSPYSFHLKRNLGQFQQKIGAVDGVMLNGVLNIIYMLTEGLLVLCLLAVLFRTNFMMTLAAMTVLAGGLLMYFYFLQDRIQSWGEKNNLHNALYWQQLNQGLGSIKESKLLGKEMFFVDRFYHHMTQMTRQQCKSDVVAKSPKLFIEVIVVGLVMSAMAICLLAGQAPGSIFVTISLFAIVSVRLMPSLNKISGSWASFKFFLPSFEAIYDDLVACEKIEGQLRARTTGAPLSLTKEIRLEDVSFSYENAPGLALDHVSLTIPRNGLVGFIGPSGAGKTTVVDMILGLLDPSGGKILVDGVDIHTHLRSWQTVIGYIPQTIYLCDDTIRNNVAFGLAAAEISDEQVWRSLRLAQLDEFVRSLPEGLNTTVGERGVRLSGGQRQRLGIARTLYHDPQVLVMDEATAALDNETERSFMEALLGLSGERTIIIIAHRLTTVQQCDKIFFLKDGRLVSEGRFEELSVSCPEFRKMVGREKF